VDGDGAAGIIDEESQLEGFDEQCDEGAGDEADEDGREGQPAEPATRPAIQPLALSEASGLR